MKDLTKYYIDLRKCSEEQQKHIEKLTNYKYRDNFYSHLYFTGFQWMGCTSCHVLNKGKTELTYPEFIKLFEGGEGEKVLQVGKILNYLSDRNDELSKKPCFENVCRMAEISRVIQMIKSNNQ